MRPGDMEGWYVHHPVDWLASCIIAGVGLWTWFDNAALRTCTALAYVTVRASDEPLRTVVNAELCVICTLCVVDMAWPRSTRV